MHIPHILRLTQERSPKISANDLPSGATLRRIIKTTLHNAKKKLPKIIEINVRYVDKKESAFLNKRYRKKTGPTNILTFCFEVSKQFAKFLPLHGDLVLCKPLIEEEAKQQNKKIKNHHAHLIVHGTLHLLGYDHDNLKKAKIMENIERKILQILKIEDPYKL